MKRAKMHTGDTDIHALARSMSETSVAATRTAESVRAMSAGFADLSAAFARARKKKMAGMG